MVTTLQNCFLSHIFSVLTIIHKAFDTNSSFHVKRRAAGKVQFLLFRRALQALTKFSLRYEEGWALDNNSMKFLDFPDIS